jgi:hypothetical protein
MNKVSIRSGPLREILEKQYMKETLRTAYPFMDSSSLTCFSPNAKLGFSLPGDKPNQLFVACFAGPIFFKRQSLTIINPLHKRLVFHMLRNLYFTPVMQLLGKSMRR